MVAEAGRKKRFASTNMIKELENSTNMMPLVLYIVKFILTEV